MQNFTLLASVVQYLLPSNQKFHAWSLRVTKLLLYLKEYSEKCCIFFEDHIKFQNPTLSGKVVSEVKTGKWCLMVWWSYQNPTDSEFIRRDGRTDVIP
jgi:hypothetical protein